MDDDQDVIAFLEPVELVELREDGPDEFPVMISVIDKVRVPRVHTLTFHDTTLQTLLPDTTEDICRQFQVLEVMEVCQSQLAQFMLLQLQDPERELENLLITRLVYPIEFT